MRAAVIRHSIGFDHLETSGGLITGRGDTTQNFVLPWNLLLHGTLSSLSTCDILQGCHVHPMVRNQTRSPTSTKHSARETWLKSIPFT